MAHFIETDLKLKHEYDTQSSRHYINGKLSVLHCHHYATLYSQLADDISFLDGKALLAEVACDVFYNVLVNYYNNNDITNIADKIAIAVQYYAATGLGKMNVVSLGVDASNIELLHSHIDEGWIKKWGNRDKPVNFITQGFIAAMVSAVNGKPADSYKVIEFESIVSGAERSTFKAIIK